MRTTTKGILWEVVAPVARWPVRSPLRLCMVTAAIVLLLVAVAHLTGGDANTTSAVSAERHTVATATSGSSTSSASSVAVPSNQSLSTQARKFVVAWARPRLSQAAWWHGILAGRPAMTFAQALSQTDPSTIPATKVTGPARVLSTTPTLVSVRVPTDAGDVMVVLAPTGGRWLVTNLLPAAKG